VHILVVEDDHRLARGLTTALTRAGFGVSRVMTAQDALAAPPPDIVLLDLGLPDGDGLQVCRALRARHACGVIMLTARAEPRERVLGLRTGADDYVVKPFAMDELLARIDAVARRTRTDRSRPPPRGVVRAGDLTLDLDARRAVAGDRELGLTPKEFDLLHLLMTHVERVCSRGMIVDQVWQAAYETPSRTLDVHIAALRTKLGTPPPVRIQTLRGVGYRLEC